MPETTFRFLDALRQSELLEEGQVESFIRQLPSNSPSDGPALAKKFIEAKLLTKFQAELLLKGRHKGFVLKGKYKILDLLGAGGMGRVFLCQHVHLNRQVAVKLLSTEQAKDVANVERFYREARAVAALDDPNIVRVYDVERDDRQPLMVMEYVDGISLHDLVLRRGPISVEQATNYIAQAALGLQHAVEVGIIHRDIKPGNLLLDRKGVVKILDMGLARFAQKEKNESLTERFDANSVLGTADYLAPEQAVDSSMVDIRADLYALGGTLFYLLTGNAPFPAPTVAEKLLAHQMKQVPSLRDKRNDVSTKLEQIYQKLMFKNPGDRFQTPEELIVALAPFADATRPMKIDWDSATETHFGKRGETTPRSSHRRHQLPSRPTQSGLYRNRMWIIGGAVAMLVIGLSVMLLMSGDGKGDPTGIVENEKTTEIPKNEGIESLKPEVKDPKSEVVKSAEKDENEFVKPEDALQHLGKKVTIEMTVVRAAYGKNNTTFFMNSEENYRDPKNFTVLLYEKAAEELFPDTDFAELEKKFKGKRIRITGIVKLYMGRAEILLEQPEQLEIIE